MRCQGFRDLNMRAGNRELQMCFRRRFAAMYRHDGEGGLSLKFVVLINRGDEEDAPHRSKSIEHAAVVQIKSTVY